MIVGTGIDIVKNTRFEKWLQNEKILERFFHSDEIEYVKSKKATGAEHLAARFAAKEAYVKALGTGFVGINLKDICVQNEPSGKPVLKLESTAQEKLVESGASTVHLSISHEREYTVAMVVLEKIQ
ncbi:MAG: holo-ACP synthase [Spirochaetaceae bacterium]|nr:holo-ACP synthase [Spirochaetaceae bacterium]